MEEKREMHRDLFTRFQQKNILVVGLGMTGLALAGYLARTAARVTISDSDPAKGKGPAAEKIRKMGMNVEVGPHQPALFSESDLILISPGVPHDMVPIQRARELGVPVMGEIEFASHYIPEPIVAVTGTNGKTTTTALLGEMLTHSGMDVFVGGNIGNPLIGYVHNGDKKDVVVIEVSSFQLDTIDRFHPAIAVLLNITQDHEDRYDSFESYARSKSRIFLNQTGKDIAVLNGMDETVRSMSRSIPGKRLFFNADFNSEYGGFVEGDTIHICMPSNGKPAFKTVFDLSKAGQMPAHQSQNATAACLAALLSGGRSNGIQSALNTFSGLPHRLEQVATIDGVCFVNDSKATNVDATIKAIDSFDAPIVLILGGLDKGGNFRALRDGIRRRVKQIILMGESAKRLESVLGDLRPSTRVGDMDEAIDSATQSAQTGDVVLLSPACSSFDMYDNYQQRGDRFREVVEDLR